MKSLFTVAKIRFAILIRKSFWKKSLFPRSFSDFEVAYDRGGEGQMTFLPHEEDRRSSGTKIVVLTHVRNVWIVTIDD